MSNFTRTFKPQFAPLVESGRKCQTVRPVPKRMPKAGDTLDAREWTGRPYGSKQRKLGVFTITEVLSVRIDAEDLAIGGRKVGWMRRNAFASADGFSSFAEMAAWFSQTHGLPFVGILIKW